MTEIATVQAHVLDPNLPKLTLGEGTHWDSRSQTLYVVDIIGQAVHRYHPASRRHRTCATPSMVSFAVLEEDGDRLIVGLQDGLYRLDFDTGQTALLAAPEGMRAQNRFNDGKCDPSGRLWAGTMNLEPDPVNPTGALYRLDESGLTVQMAPVGISNGLGWTADGRHMVHTDTLGDPAIRLYDYDPLTGTFSNGRNFIAEKSDAGDHDGLAVDKEGRVLTAKWGGSAVEIYNAAGRLVGRVAVPAPHVSNCAFGGADMKTLFITTARDGLSDAELAAAPLSGSIFVAQMDVAGVPVARCRLPVREQA